VSSRTLAIISDTHMPRGPRQLPPSCVEALRAADLIIHAGDIMTMAVFEQISAYGPPLIAVHGNVDEPALKRALPEVATVQFDRFTIAVTHDAGPAKARLDRLRNRFPHADAVVFGHSHIPLHERSQDGFQIFNPGSPTERRRSPHKTMGIARVGEQGLGFEVVVVG
jgi:uncharacterized protein